MLNVQYGIAISMLLHASPVWMRHVEPIRRSGCSAGSCYYIAVVVVDVKICWFESINGYPIFSVVQLYAVALVCSCKYPVWASVRVG